MKKMMMGVFFGACVLTACEPTKPAPQASSDETTPPEERAETGEEGAAKRGALKDQKQGAASEESAPGEGYYLVWTRTFEQMKSVTRTRFVQVQDGTLTEVGARDGLFTSFGGALVELTAVKTQDEVPPACPGEGEDNDQAMLRMKGYVGGFEQGPQIDLFAPPEAVDAPRVHREVAHVVGTLGPLVFMDGSVIASECGGRPFSGLNARFKLIDVNSGEPDSYLTDVVFDRAEDVKKEAMMRLRAGEDVKDCSDPDLKFDEVEPTLFFPRVTEQGRIIPVLQMTGPASGSCADGEWDEYTRSVQIPLKAWPQEYEGYDLDVPAPVAALVARLSAEGRATVGVSAATWEASDHAAARAVFTQ